MAVTAEELREWAAKAGLGDSEVEHRVIASRQYYNEFESAGEENFGGIDKGLRNSTSRTPALFQTGRPPSYSL